MNMTSLVFCEIRKAYKSTVFWVITAMFTVLPFLSLIKYAGSLNVNWDFYLAEVLKTFTAILIIGFAFTTCWIFGREYTDKTINDLLVKPVSKLSIALSKFITVCLWNCLLTICMFAVVVFIGVYVGLSGGAFPFIFHYFFMFMVTSLLTMFVSTVNSFMANVTKGYLAPIGLIFLIVVIVNVVENVGLSAYVPWTIPRLLFSEGALGLTSICILTVTGIIGFTGTVAWWRFMEQQ